MNRLRSSRARTSRWTPPTPQADNKTKLVQIQP